MKPNKRLIVDIEAEIPGTPNNGQRKKRREFYIRNGYSGSEVKYSWRGEYYEVLVSGGGITNEDFEGFWKHLAKENESFQKY